MIELKDVDVKIGDQVILNNVSISLKEKECVAVIGENGTGKSLLLKLLAGVVSPTKGQVRRDIKEYGYAPEIPPKSLHFTAKEYLTHMGRIEGMSREELENRVTLLFKQFNFNFHFHQDYIYKLSKGNKQKINLMQSLLREPSILLLDEPLSGLDPHSQENLLQYLKQLKEKKTTIIFTCHEGVLKENLADRILLIENKEVKEGEMKTEKSYRTVQFSGNLDEISPLINKTVDMQTLRRLQDGIFEVNVEANNSDKLLLTIINQGGKIKFLSKKSRI
ncbi:ATP-binding cassette domain-containing protein [Oceanobacillus jordanicus]|uniref:ABC transporter ATP-binding protein n=1 Tax=Oceanobacillus jordanicus TaxID=2867266 RepID=A0AAW5BCZ1_9BACI|nr:ABC transporter ATP-binding protein [Oceanobacillus jordanicus]MCG3420945.1 ABC transporter ATP-binding protein [Oceanobacillus jordanicus]